MNKLIELPNGDLIHADAIRAIRLLGPVAEDKLKFQRAQKPRVIVDFEIGVYDNCIVLDCDTVEERDKLAAELKAKL